MKKILVINNYDSFVYNIVQLLRESEKCFVEVVFNDKLENRSSLLYDGVVISPGPGLPEKAGMLMDFVDKNKATMPILGVCLGHQALAQSFGATLIHLPLPMHGHKTILQLTGYDDKLFMGIRDKISVGRYHSWVVDERNFPSELIVSSRDEQGNIMSFFHETLSIHGVQFHPESYISNCGTEIISNWLDLC
jgi:anthranilate synthase component II